MSSGAASPQYVPFSAPPGGLIESLEFANYTYGRDVFELANFSVTRPDPRLLASPTCSQRTPAMTTFAITRSRRSPALRRTLRGLLVAAASIGAGAAAAADFHIGAAAGVDRGRGDCVASFACDRSSSFGKLFAGARIGDAVDVQAMFFDAGRFKGGDTTPLGTAFGGKFDVSGFGFTGGTRWELAPSWSLAARAGVAAVRTRFDYVNPAFGSKTKTMLQPLVGIGLAYAITPAVRIGLDYDVTRFKAHTSRGSLQLLGLAAQYSF